MNTQEQIKQLREEFEARLVELEASTKQPEPWKRWRAEKGDPYWFVSPNGTIHVWDESGAVINDERFARGNYYRTKEEAIRADERDLAHQEFKDMAEGYKFIGGEENWYIYFDVVDKEFYADSCVACKEDTVYFPSEEKLKQAMEKLGEDKLKLICGVE